MAGFVEGVDRGQCTLFPPSLEDYVAGDNPVRAVDVFVEGLDLSKPRICVRWQPLKTGRPGYAPKTMLQKIYIYGYLNRCAVEPPPGAGMPAAISNSSG